MALIGLTITLLGFVISLLSLALATSPGGRLAVVLAGLVVSLTGIMGVINRAYLRNAIWRR